MASSKTASSSSTPGGVGGGPDVVHAVHDAQELVGSLTATVRSLRDDKKALKASLESVSRENVRLRADLAAQASKAETDRDAHALQSAQQQALLNKLQERCSKLELLCQLGTLQRDELREKAGAAAEEEARRAQCVAQAQYAVHVERDKLVKRAQTLQGQLDRLREYAARLEAEVEQQYVRLRARARVCVCVCVCV